MIRRIVALAACILLLTQAAVFSQSEIVYGDTLQHLRMSGVFPSREYWNMYSGREACEISTAKAYRGGTSLKIDVTKLKQLEKPLFNFSTQFVYPDTYDADNGSLYFEWYVYGINEDIFSGRVSFSSYYTYSDGTTKVIRDGMNYELSDKDGWVKIWTLVPKKSYGNVDSCNMGILYNPNNIDMNQVDCFYIDEMAIRVVPDTLYIKDIHAKNYVDLSRIRVFGVDASGNKRLVNAKDYFNWSVTDGEGYVDNGVLKYAGETDGNVVVRCGFFGVETEFNVSFEKTCTVRYSDLVHNDDGSINVTAYNDGDDIVIADVVFALYDGQRLYTVRTVKADVPANNSKAITSTPIKIPSNIANPVIKVYGWDSVGGMSILK